MIFYQTDIFHVQNKFSVIGYTANGGRKHKQSLQQLFSVACELQQRFKQFNEVFAKPRALTYIHWP